MLLRQRQILEDGAVGRSTASKSQLVKRQCDVTGSSLTAEQWLTQLQLECDVKRKDESDSRSVG